MIRDSSPPDAASFSGEVGIPGLVETSSSTTSAPLGPNSSGWGSSTTSSRAPSIARSASSAATRSASRSPASRRAALSFAASFARRASAPPIRAASSPATSSAFSSRSISARQRSAWASTASIEPPCLRFSRSSASRRSSTASSLPAPPRSRRGSPAGRRPRHRAPPPPPAGARRARRARGRAGDRGEARVGLAERRTRPAAVLVGAADRRQRPGGTAAQPLGVAQHGALRLELGLLGLVGAGGLDLSQLEAHQVEVAFARALTLAKLGELARQGGRSPWAARYWSRSSSCDSPAKPSRISSWAEARVSRRCSCCP